MGAAIAVGFVAEVVAMAGFRQRLRDLGRNVSTLTWVGFGLAAGFLAFAALMVAGYGLTDPGGWTGLGLTTLWLVSLVLVLVVGLPLAVAGLSRPAPAGALLLTITVVPWVLSVLGAGSDWARALSIGMVTVPVLAGGLLLLLAGRFWTGAGAHLSPRRPVLGH